MRLIAEKDHRFLHNSEQLNSSESLYSTILSVRERPTQISHQLASAQWYQAAVDTRRTMTSRDDVDSPATWTQLTHDVL